LGSGISTLKPRWCQKPDRKEGKLKTLAAVAYARASDTRKL
jgi:hypothetical protein